MRNFHLLLLANEQGRQETTTECDTNKLGINFRVYYWVVSNSFLFTSFINQQYVLNGATCFGRSLLPCDSKLTRPSGSFAD